MISLTATTGLLEMIEARGSDPDKVLAPLGLERRAFCDPHGFIRDADFAAETAALTRAQVLVQSGTQVLAIANQQPQNVLALLRNA